MIFKRISRSQPEQVFVVVQNVSGGTLTAGYPAVWDLSANVDGVRVTQPATTHLAAIAGIADADISNNDFGLVQAYGYRSSAYIYSSAGSSAAGDDLTITNAEWGMTPQALDTGINEKLSWGFLAEAVSASSSSQYHTTASVFIRAL